jgi:K+-transporting ATPase KdpF subunit
MQFLGGTLSMKNLKIINEMLTEHQAIAELFGTENPQKTISFKLFLALCLNLLIAPTVYAANSGAVSRGSSYAIGLLVIVTVILAIYLLFAMLQPQRF